MRIGFNTHEESGQLYQGKLTTDATWERVSIDLADYVGKKLSSIYSDLTFGNMVGWSYWTNTPVPYMREIREQLRDTIAKYGLKFWQTELCIMGNDEEIGGGGGYYFSMKTALYVARVIHHDLVFADAESWSWWRSVGENYKDGLIRVYTPDHMKSGYAVDSRLMWALGNYSRFIRPGAVRYAVSSSSDFDPYGVMCSAYRNANGQWVAVVINYSEKMQDISLHLPGEARSWRMYRTSDVSGETLKPIGTTSGSTVLPPRSITTFVD